MGLILLWLFSLLKQDRVGGLGGARFYLGVAVPWQISAERASRGSGGPWHPGAWGVVRACAQRFDAMSEVTSKVVAMTEP